MGTSSTFFAIAKLFSRHFSARKPHKIYNGYNQVQKCSKLFVYYEHIVGAREFVEHSQDVGTSLVYCEHVVGAWEFPATSIGYSQLPKHNLSMLTVLETCLVSAQLFYRSNYCCLRHLLDGVVFSDYYCFYFHTAFHFINLRQIRHPTIR